MDRSLDCLKYSHKFSNLYFCEIFELWYLENTIHRKLTSGFLLCDKASLSKVTFDLENFPSVHMALYPKANFK
jgi:hypothetical protein